MEVMERLLLTEEGWRKLHQELESLRAEVGILTGEYAQLSRSVDSGDATSHFMRSDIASLDRRIAQLEDVLRRALPVSADQRVPGVVGVGSRVTVRWSNGEEESFRIVGPPEVSASDGHISYESPVGRALMNGRQGESVQVSTPNGVSHLQIVEVQ